MLTKREIFNELNRLTKSILLIGPRQSGKSTLIKQLQPDVEFNLADQETFLQFLRDPTFLKKNIGQAKKIFVDEVQRVPSVLNTIQVLIDNNPKLQFYLTGSSARKLKRGQANLLPGRILTFELGPLTSAELGKDFDLNRALSRGLLPGVYWQDSDKLAYKTLSSYALTYLKEEIQAESLTRNLEGFSRFFEVVASRSGDFTDFSKFSSQAMIERTSARRYFDILVDTLVVNKVESFSKSSKRRLVQHPRYYFFDIGVLNGCLNNFVVSADRKGMLFEHLFLQNVLSSAKSNDEEIYVSVYRTEAGAEVDFIIQKKNQLYAVEVKATKNIGVHDLRGLKSFSEFYGKKHRSIIVYLGERELEIDGIQCLPFVKAMEIIGF